MIVLGIILIVLGLLFWHPLFVIGCVLAVVGLCLFLANSVGHGVGGRHYW